MSRPLHAASLLLTAALALGCAKDSGAAPSNVDAGIVPSGKDASADGAASDAGLDFPVTQVAVGSMTFNVRFAGPETGEFVLLLHGFPETSYEWRHQMRALAAAGYRVAAPDQRGYSPGARPEAVTAYTILDLLGDATGLVDALGVQRFHVVGHDWGAAVAWGIGIVAPARVITLTSVSIPEPAAFDQVLADPSTCQHDASAYFDTFSAADAGGLFLYDDAKFLQTVYAGLPADAVREYVGVLDQAGAMRGALNWYRANVQDRQIKGVPTTPVTVPTLLIWGDQNPFICHAGIDISHQFVTGPYRLEILHGVGHWAPELAADQVTALLLQQLASGRVD